MTDEMRGIPIATGGFTCTSSANARSQREGGPGETGDDQINSSAWLAWPLVRTFMCQYNEGSVQSTGEMAQLGESSGVDRNGVIGSRRPRTRVIQSSMYTDLQTDCRCGYPNFPVSPPPPFSKSTILTELNNDYLMIIALLTICNGLIIILYMGLKSLYIVYIVYMAKRAIFD
ncbi:hypothetical protein F5Y18DRAFT_31551 [Xylariaceae sp. FL1019]|nr:hypothetical protein F5Y18DRAFT_31551 [Xylariaceae sp. FL1019]